MAEERSFAHAAERLYVPQPALSKQIRQVVDACLEAAAAWDMSSI